MINHYHGTILDDAAAARLVQEGRDRHIMRVRIKQPDNSLPEFDVDGADGVGGAQYMNDGKGTNIANNAKFKDSGVISALYGISTGAELLMDYGKEYWKAHGKKKKKKGKNKA